MAPRPPLFTTVILPSPSAAAPTTPFSTPANLTVSSSPCSNPPTQSNPNSIQPPPEDSPPPLSQDKKKKDRDNRARRRYKVSGNRSGHRVRLPPLCAARIFQLTRELGNRTHGQTVEWLLSNVHLPPASATSTSTAAASEATAEVVPMISPELFAPKKEFEMYQSQTEGFLDTMSFTSLLLQAENVGCEGDGVVLNS